MIPLPAIQSRINGILGGLAVKVFSLTQEGMTGYYPNGFSLNWPGFCEDLHAALILDAWKRYNTWAGPNKADVVENERKRRARDESQTLGQDLEHLGRSLLIGVHETKTFIKRPRKQ